MKLLNNIRTILCQPPILLEFIRYLRCKMQNGGKSERLLNGIKITGFSGFSEYHSCSHFVSSAELDFLKHYSFPSGPLVDVGANLGIVSLILSKRFHDRKLHAFEPNPSTFTALQTNLKINDCINIIPHQSAVAAHNGEVSFAGDQKSRGTTRIAKTPSENVISVPCVTLDKFLKDEGIGELGFLKVDVEGYEMLVFQGAGDLIKKPGARLIYYEICPELTRQAGFAPEDPSRFLLDNNYQLHTLNAEGKLVPAQLSQIKTIVCDNWIALKR